jgi:hypothetical protein
MMLRFYNNKSSMLYNSLKVDEAWCFILNKLLVPEVPWVLN